MSEPRWLTREIVIILHGELIAEHGGAMGLRNDDALQAAIARPRQKHHYESHGVPALAAAYAFGLSKGHPFVDGNKRLSLAALDVFLRLNGWALTASEAETTTVFLDLAAGNLSEDDLITWVAQNAEQLEGGHESK